MSTTQDERKREARELIEAHGGPAKLCEELGWDKDGGTQRVQNWLDRGIPSDVKVSYPEIFLAHLIGAPAVPEKAGV